MDISEVDLGLIKCYFVWTQSVKKMGFQVCSECGPFSAGNKLGILTCKKSHICTGTPTHLTKPEFFPLKNHLIIMAHGHQVTIQVNSRMTHSLKSTGVHRPPVKQFLVALPWVFRHGCACLVFPSVSIHT